MEPRHRCLQRLLGLALLTLSWVTMAMAEAPITLLYYERKPFHYTTETGAVTGLLATQTEEAFRKAGLSFVWKRVPVNRVLETLKNGGGRCAAPGWYKTAERATYATLSAPIYVDKPLVGLARAGCKVPKGIKAADLFTRREIRLLVRENFSQGAYLDALIAHMPPGQVQTVAVEVPLMVQMLKANRADLILTTQEEVPIQVAQSGSTMQDFEVLHFPDVPAVEKRYILLSHQVPADQVRRLDEAIRTTVTLARH